MQNKTAQVQKGSRRQERTVKILKLVALGAVLLLVGGSPSPKALSKIVKEFRLKDSPENRRKAYQSVYSLRRRGYLSPRADMFQLSPKARLLLEKADLWDIEIPIPEHWDLAWRLVIFDIPEDKAKTRVFLVRLLQNLGLIMYQRSVWVYPYPLEEEVSFIAKLLKVEPYVSFVTALNIDGYGTLKKQFGLT